MRVRDRATQRTPIVSIKSTGCETLVDLDNDGGGVLDGGFALKDLGIRCGVGCEGFGVPALAGFGES